MKSRWIGNFGISVGSLCLLALLLEAVWRFAFPLSEKSPYAMRVPDPTLGWVLEKDARYLHTTPEFSVEVEYDAQGWRDRPVAAEDQEARRILVLGDSFFEGFTVDSDECFHVVLEEMLAEDVRTFNRSVGGYGTLQELRVLKQEGPRLDPDVVLLGFHPANDPRNNLLELEAVAKPGSMKVDSRPFLVSADPWTVREADYPAARRRYDAAIRDRSTGITGWLRQHSMLARSIHQRLWQLWTAPSTTAAGARQTDEAWEHAMFGVQGCVETPEYERAWQTTRQLLAAVARESRALGAQLHVVSVPSVFDVEPVAMREAQSSLSVPDDYCYEEAPAYARLEGILRDLGISYIDLLPAFRRAARTDGQSLFRKERHWNAAGHALAARTVAQHLRTQAVSGERRN